jgi:hypothetical protein
MSSDKVRKINTLLQGEVHWINDHYAIFYHGKIIGNNEIGVYLAEKKRSVPSSVEEFYELLRSIEGLEKIRFEDESEDAKKEFENFFRGFEQYYQSEGETIRKNVEMREEDQITFQEFLESLKQQVNIVDK